MGLLFSVENPIISMDKSLRVQGYSTPSIVITTDRMPHARVKWYNPGTKTERTLAHTYVEEMSPKEIIKSTEKILHEIKISRGCDPSVSRSDSDSTIQLS